MATAYITFGRSASTDNNQPSPIYKGEGATSQTVTTSGAAAQSTASADATVATVFSDAAHYVAVGANPTATATNGRYTPANVPVDISIKDGDKLSLITV